MWMIQCASGRSAYSIQVKWVLATVSVPHGRRPVRDGVLHGIVLGLLIGGEVRCSEEVRLSSLWQGLCR